MAPTSRGRAEPNTARGDRNVVLTGIERVAMTRGLKSALLTSALVLGATGAAFAEGSGDAAVETPDVAIKVEPPTPADPFVRVQFVEPTRPIEVTGYALERVEFGAQLTRTGRTVTAVSAGLLLATTVVAAATGTDCYNDSSCDGFAASMAGVGLSALGLWGGTITWSSGTLIAANGMRRAGVPVRNGAGIAAVALSALYFPGSWIAAPVQHHVNRNAWDHYVAGQPRRPRLTLVPIGPGGRWGGTLGVRF
jgi:hypothetical protein